MSIKIMSAVFESETLGPTERLIMLSLADHADDTGRCYPSIARLAQRTGLSERAIQTNMRGLQAKGYLSVAANEGKGGVNVYFVLATPAADAPPQQMHPTPAADAPEPSRTIIEPSFVVGGRGPSFDEFWASWPLSKVGKDASKRAWSRLSPAQRRLAKERAAEWCRSWRAANPRLNAIHPATYLNNKRWEDEAPPCVHASPQVVPIDNAASIQRALARLQAEDERKKAAMQ